MGFINKIIAFFFPHLHLKENESHAYFVSEKEVVRLNMLTIFPLIALGYPLHYFYFDGPMGLVNQSPFWFYFRFGMSVSSILGVILYLQILKPHNKYYRLYAGLVLLAAITLQAYATFLYQEAPFLYPFVFVLVSLFLLRLTVMQNIFYSALCLIISTQILLETQNIAMNIYSAAFVTFIITLIMSTRNLSSILLYKSNLEKITAQKLLIERQIEIVDHLRGFLPKQIFHRFHELSSVHKYSTAAALDNILRPKRKEIACLFSDIRGYTQHSKNTMVLETQILPTIKESSVIIEDNFGIPRKIGDLIFAYFDEESTFDNINNCFLSALHMASKSLAEGNTIHRSIILSHGSAIVGNIGGAGSAIEITAMGNPSNECARIDEFIKKNSLFHNKIIFSDSFFEKLMITHDINTELYKFEGHESVRDFSEIRKLNYIDFSYAKELLYNKQKRSSAA